MISGGAALEAVEGVRKNVGEVATGEKHKGRKEGKARKVARLRDSAKSGNWSSLRLEEKLWRDWLHMGDAGKWPRVCQPRRLRRAPGG